MSDGRGSKNIAPSEGDQELPDFVREELETMTTTERAAVIMLLMGETQASDIIQYMNPREVQALGSAMVGVVDLSTVSAVLDDFVGTIKQQTNLGLGTTDYVESVLKRALGDDKASTVLSRILPGGSTKGLEILRWMDARAISDMINNEHPQVIAIILSVLEYDTAADVLSFLPPDNRAEVMQRVAKLETVQPSAMEELERIMSEQFSSNSSAQSSSLVA